MPQPYQALTQSQVDHFLEKGYLLLKDCFSRDLATEWTAFAFKRLGYDPQNPATWQEERVHLPGMERLPVAEIAPRAHAAICDLMGGPERIREPGWGDGFVINFSVGADAPWQPPSPQAGGWHKDGDFFRHFLDSPEQGLLTIVVWSDILPQSGGTFIACDSVGHIARLLAEHPEGMSPGQFNFKEIIDQCRDFVELTARAGDVALLHPFILHAASRNPSGRPRFITNPPVSLVDPMDFNREDPAAFSLVERAVLRGLGAERYDFQPTAPRERIIPERERRQKKMLQEQKARLGLA